MWMMQIKTPIRGRQAPVWRSGIYARVHTRRISHAGKPTAPIGAYAYFDQVRLWVERPLTRLELAPIAAECVYLQACNEPSRFLAGKYRQLLRLHRPSSVALEWVAKSGGLLNYAEVALDALFDNLAQRDDAECFWRYAWCRRHHNKRDGVRFHENSRYDGSRYRPRITDLYPQSHSRVTGELNCLHFEVRFNGKESCEAVGITPFSLLDFDFNRFWSEYLLGFNVDEERLGRLVRNRANGTKSRTAPMVRLGNRQVNLDRRLGATILNGSETLQQALDRFGGIGKLRPALKPVEVGAYLPS